MSVTIQLMKNYSDNNVVSKNLETLSTISGTFREPTNILNPVITIEGNLPTDCNYMYIQEFSRYYYIIDIVAVNNNLFQVSAHVDVLNTYKDQIKECEAIIARQETLWNLYVDDGSFKVYQNELFTLKQFPSGFTTQEFVLAVAGG